MIINKLKNGIKYFLKNNKCSTSTTVSFLVNVGSINEKKNQEGMAHFLEHMLFKGTKERLKSKNITNNIYKLGGYTNAYTSNDTTGYYIDISNDYIKDALDILSDMLFNSTFVDLEKEKDVVISENKKTTSVPQQKLFLKFDKIIYKNTPYEHDVGGTNSIIKKFTRENVIKFYKKYYKPRNIIVSIVGKLPKNIDKLINKYFNKQVSDNKLVLDNNLPVKNFMDMQKKKRFFSIVDNVDQAKVIIGFPSYAGIIRKTFVLFIINTVLAGNMSSRLFIKLREKMGLVYNVSSNININPDCGYFYITFGTFINKIDKATDAVISELIDIKKNGITEEELTNSVNYLCGMLDLDNDNNSIALSNGYNILKYNKIFKKDEEKKIYRSIKLNEIIEVASDIFQYNKLNHGILSNKSHLCKIKNIG
jgi:predicted Zn-dependent peptidase